MEELKKQLKVMVYQDPLTCQKPEGDAVLIKKMEYAREQENGIQNWKVRFISDGFVTERLINIKTH